jgi:UDP-N-acetylmuramate: L-alanyl-gamma-D-glutamyl-meso-diaminopimelate ligase
VIEGDEYDSAFFDKRPKFVHYLPSVAVVGNVEFDHADIYPDLEAVQTAFTRLLHVIPRSGLLVAGSESPALVSILAEARCRVLTFGLAPGADWRAVDVETGPSGSSFRLLRAGRDAGRFTMPLAGEHNVRNALAALAVAAEAGAAGDAAEALAAFRGSRRSRARRGRHGLRRLRPPSDGGPRDACAALSRSGRLAAARAASYTSRTRVFQDDFARAFMAATRSTRARPPARQGPEARGCRKPISSRRPTAGPSRLPSRSRGDRLALAGSLGGDRVATLSNGFGIREKLPAR